MNAHFPEQSQLPLVDVDAVCRKVRSLEEGQGPLLMLWTALHPRGSVGSC